LTILLLASRATTPASYSEPTTLQLQLFRGRFGDKASR